MEAHCRFCHVLPRGGLGKPQARMVEHSGLVDKTVGPTKHPISHPVPIKAQPGDPICGNTVEAKRVACGDIELQTADGECDLRRNCRAGDVGPRWLDDRRPEGPGDLSRQGAVSGTRAWAFWQPFPHSSPSSIWRNSPNGSMFVQKGSHPTHLHALNTARRAA